jgi:hypothetical protein
MALAFPILDISADATEVMARHISISEVLMVDRSKSRNSLSSLKERAGVKRGFGLRFYVVAGFCRA